MNRSYVRQNVAVPIARVAVPIARVPRSGERGYNAMNDSGSMPAYQEISRIPVSFFAKIMVDFCQARSIHDETKVIAVSRSTLERRFGEFFGYSPAQEIKRIRIEHAKVLLRETAWPDYSRTYVPSP